MAKKICIAPGHGGFDPGAVGNGMMEKNINLTIGLELQKLLTEAGVPVVMTREGDYAAGQATTVNGDLENECAISNNADADLFFCIHTNSGGGHGAEIYVYPGSEVKELALEVVDEVGAHMGLHGDPVKEDAGLYVLRYTKAQAMLLEIGFIDSSDAEKIRADLNDFAGWIAPALIEWAGGTIKTSEPATVEAKPEEKTAAPAATSTDTTPPAIHVSNSGDVTVNVHELANILQQLVNLVTKK